MKYIKQLSINEGYVYLTDRFKSILNDIGIKSDISYDLIRSDKREFKPDLTFIDISDKDGYVSFSQSGNIVKKVSDIIDFKFSSKDNIVLTDTDVQMVLKDGSIFDKARNEIKIGRLISTLFPNKYTDKQIEEFTSIFKSEVNKNKFTFKIVEGEEISKYYDESNYQSKGEGSLGASCMRYSYCKSFLEIYEKNPNVCCLLVLVDSDDKVVGRSILWKDFIIDEYDITPKYIMDRIYYQKDYMINTFIQWARENDTMYKSSNNNNDIISFTYNGIKYDKLEISILLDETSFEDYPFMDTFKVLNGYGNLVNRAEPNISDDEIGLIKQDGSVYEGIWSDYENRMVESDPEGDGIWSDYESSYLDPNNSVFIENREDIFPTDAEYIVFDPKSESYYHIEDTKYSEIGEYHYFVDDHITALIGNISINDLFNVNKSNIDKYISNFSENDDRVKDLDKLLCFKLLSEYNYIKPLLKDMKIYVGGTDSFYYNSNYGKYIFAGSSLYIDSYNDFGVMSPWRKLINFEPPKDKLNMSKNQQIDILSIPLFFDCDVEIEHINNYLKDNLITPDIRKWLDILKKLEKVFN